MLQGSPGWLCPLLAILLIGAIMCRTKITVKSGAEHHRRTRRPQAGALLTVILVGSRLERRKDGHPHVGAPGGRNGGRPGTGSARGSARAAARRAPKVLRRSCQSNGGEYLAGACARP